MSVYLCISELSDEHLERKIDLCHELLEVADALSPGMSRMRGVLLFELQAAMVVNTRREFESEQITKERAQVTKHCFGFSDPLIAARGQPPRLVESQSLGQHRTEIKLIDPGQRKNEEVLGDAMTLLQSSAEILRSDPDMKAQLEEKLVALAKELEPN
ncbi:unnamed protein product [Timema podura]|uniref:Uncharacterized protein n=1 Tax=Timema podura TaxID=61482 RepID=A0ABN7PI13_TIMPD|nr:unnamed protein product [Timema podura]